MKSEVEKSGDSTFKALKTYGRDHIEKAGKLDPIIGCNEEIRKVDRIFSRTTKNIEEPVVGKTTVVAELAKRILRGDVPSN